MVPQWRWVIWGHFFHRHSMINNKFYRDELTVNSTPHHMPNGPSLSLSRRIAVINNMQISCHFYEFLNSVDIPLVWIARQNGQSSSRLLRLDWIVPFRDDEAFSLEWPGMCHLIIVLKDNVMLSQQIVHVRRTYQDNHGIGKGIESDRGIDVISIATYDCDLSSRPTQL